MSFAHFLRIERDEQSGSRHYVVHVCDPRFSLELAPDGAAPDHIGQGVIKRICLPNSCAGDYHKYIKLLDAAQDEPAEAKRCRDRCGWAHRENGRHVVFAACQRA